MTGFRLADLRMCMQASVFLNPKTQTLFICVYKELVIPLSWLKEIFGDLTLLCCFP